MTQAYITCNSDANVVDLTAVEATPTKPELPGVAQGIPLKGVTVEPIQLPSPSNERNYEAYDDPRNYVLFVSYRLCCVCSVVFIPWSGRNMKAWTPGTIEGCLFD